MAEQEIGAAADGAKKPRWIRSLLLLVAAIAVCAVIAVCFLTNPEPQGDNALLQPTDMDESESESADLPETENADDSQTGAGDGSGAGDTDTPETGKSAGHETEIGNVEEQPVDNTETQSSASPEPQNKADPEPEYIAGPEINTGYPGYDALLAEVQDILLDYYNLDIYSEGIEDRFWPELLMMYPEKLGYILRDLDGNGVEELIFGEDSSNGQGGVIYDLYTIVDGEVVNVFVGGSRSRYYLCDNGCIANENASSAFEAGNSYYTYRGTELTLMEAVIYDFGKQLYSTEYEYYLEEYPPELYREITDEEIEEVMAKYVYEYLPFTPLVELLSAE